MYSILVSLFAFYAYATDYTATYTRPWQLSRVAEPTVHASGQYAFSVYDMGSCTGVTCPHNGESGVATIAVAKDANGNVLPNWNWVKCGALYDPVTGTNNYLAAFGALKGNWPPVWPATLECNVSENSDTLSTVITIAPAIDPDWGSDTFSVINLAAGYTLTLQRDVVTGYKVGALNVTKGLPAGTYTSGTYNAKQGALTWPGVTCKVTEAGAADKIEYAVSETAAAGTGVCPIVKNGVVTNTPVTVVRQ